MPKVPAGRDARGRFLGGPKGDPFARGRRRVQWLALTLSPVAADQGALFLEKLIKKQLSQKGKGRRYPRGDKTHTASAPGQSPAVDFGDLRRSIGRERIGKSWRVGTMLLRAAALEFGHVYASGRVLAPRPYMRPAAAKLPRFGPAVATDIRIRGRAIAALWPD